MITYIILTLLAIIIVQCLGKDRSYMLSMVIGCAFGALATLVFNCIYFIWNINTMELKTNEHIFDENGLEITELVEYESGKVKFIIDDKTYYVHSFDTIVQSKDSLNRYVKIYTDYVANGNLVLDWMFTSKDTRNVLEMKEGNYKKLFDFINDKEIRNGLPETDKDNVEEGKDSLQTNVEAVK